MVSSVQADYNVGSYHEIEDSTAPLLPKLRDAILVDIPPVQTELPLRSSSRKASECLREWFLAPFSIFRRAVDQREEASLSVPSPAGIRRHLHFMRKIDWVSLRKACKEWLKNPKNVALLLWLICVACFLSLLFLLLTELVDGVFPSTHSRNHWIEICNQVLNALFTLMSLYQHPNLFHHLVLLCRWRSEDIIELRKVYCKNGAYRPHEWVHMMVAVFLLHMTCFDQYVLCGLYWGYRSSQRPAFAEDFCVAIGVMAPVLAGVYTVYSPLGREYDSNASVGEPPRQVIDLKRKSKLGLKLHEQRVAVSKPKWNGGLFDLGDDVPVAFLSVFCTCCVFGWNMRRLGFGNMYVHIATFALLFIAPYWVFSNSALNIHNGVIRHAVRITGMVLSLLCLLYGGFWRIQMRRRFKLPENTFCCGDGSMTDYLQWMFCWGCSLAQEVRTGNFYEVDEDSLYRKHAVGGEEEGQVVSLPSSASCDGGESASVNLGSSSDSQLPSSQLSSLPCPEAVVAGECGSEGRQLVAAVDKGSSSSTGGDGTMVPPAPPSMQVEDKHGNGGVNLPEIEDVLPPSE